MRKFKLLLTLAIILPVATASANRGTALIIGNNNYATLGKLFNPINDATLLQATLTKLNFTVTLLTDSTQQQMQQAIVDFSDALIQNGPDTVGLFYYSGHGVQINERNFLIPIEAKAKRNKDFNVVAIAADMVVEAMRNAGNSLNFIILDACRNAPFTESRTVAGGLARMTATQGTLIAYSTAPGEVADDGTAGNNSPYAAALAHAMLVPNVAVERMFRQVRNQVLQTTQQRQVPWEHSSLIGEDYFFNPGIAIPDSTLLPTENLSPSNTTPSYTDKRGLSLYLNFLTRANNDGEFKPFTDGATLHSGDQYQIMLRPAAAGFLYIFQTDAAGTIQRLFPMAEYKGKQLGNINPVQANTTYFLPKQGKAYTLDNTIGTEKIYVFAAREARPEIENLATTLAQAQTAGDIPAETTAAAKLNTLFKSRDLPLTATTIDTSTQISNTSANITEFFQNTCADCVHVLEFKHQ